MNKRILSVDIVACALIIIIGINKCATFKLDENKAEQPLMAMNAVVASEESGAEMTDEELNTLKMAVQELPSVEYSAGIARLIDQFTYNEDVGTESEYSNFAIAKVNNYVNVRKEPDTKSEVVGKMYDGSVAEVLSKVGEGEEQWFQVVSGKVEGYIKAEYFIYGNEAADVIEDYIIRKATIKADRLNVRSVPNKNSKRIGYINNGEKVKVLEQDIEDVEGESDTWIKIEYTSGKAGYIASQYTTVEEEFIYAKSIEEERAEEEARRALQAALAQRQQQSEDSAPESTVIQVAPPTTDYSSVSELRTAIVNYAMQFLGNRYVSGGQSLVTGTDCSGFTCYIYKEFGINLSRIPHGQWTGNGRRIEVSELQPGDLVFYSQNKSKCSHVGIYIGNGQIIHSANSRKGVIISNMYYDKTYMGVKNVID